MEDLTSNIHIMRNKQRAKGIYKTMANFIPFCLTELSFKTEQKNELFSTLSEITRKKETDIIDTTLYHFVHYSHCTSKESKTKIAKRLLQSIGQRRKNKPTRKGVKPNINVAPGEIDTEENPDVTMDDVLDEITCDVQYIRKNHQADGM